MSNKYNYDLEVALNPVDTYLISGVVTYDIKEGEPSDEYSPGYADEAESIDATVKKAECIDPTIGYTEVADPQVIKQLEEAANAHFEKDDEELVKHAEVCRRNY